MTKDCDICSMSALDCIKCIEINGKPWCEIRYQENTIEAERGKENE